MFKFTVFVFASILACQIIGTDGSPVSPVSCGPIPQEVYVCFRAPPMVTVEVADQCQNQSSECEKMICMFRESGWMDGDKVDKVKLSTNFDQVAKNHPDWAQAVEKTKTHCLAHDLPAQGIHLNCPTYDIASCVFQTFVKNTKPTQWKSPPYCDIARQYAENCPICPKDCFAAQRPTGSCNACLPRSL